MHPPSVIWVTLLFLGIHQIEGHIVVPNVMGSALRLHPLLVIFGLLAGGESTASSGALIALPLLAAPRDVGVLRRAPRARAVAGGGAIPVEVEPVEQLEPSAIAAARVARTLRA